MVLISHSNKFIFIKTIKTASTSVETFFERYCNGKGDVIGCRGGNISPNKGTSECKISNTPKNAIIDGKIGWYHHMPPKRIIDKLGEKTWNNHFKFTTVRNPWDAMVSLYFFMGIEKGIEFKEWVKKYRVPLGNWKKYTLNDKVCVDFFIRYENLIEDVKKVIAHLNLDIPEDFKLPSHHSNFRKEKKHYSEYYDEETKKIVYELNKKEIDYFGYIF
jgi:hypothetical protein